MKTFFFCAALLLGGRCFAADAKPAEKQPEAAAPAAKPARKPAREKQAAPAPAAARPEAAAPAAEQRKPAPKARRAAEKTRQEEEPGEVLIDSRSGEDADGGRAAVAAEEEAPAPNSLPASLGQLKGVLAEGGRSMLVFEGDDGAVSFVQVSFGRSGVSWKLVDRLARSNE